MSNLDNRFGGTYNNVYEFMRKNDYNERTGEITAGILYVLEDIRVELSKQTDKILTEQVLEESNRQEMSNLAEELGIELSYLENAQQIKELILEKFNK